MIRGRSIKILPVPLLLVATTACFPFAPGRGGGNTAFEPPRRVDPAHVAVVDGYTLEVVAEGLTYPTGVTFDDAGNAYVTESGYSYGEVFTVPRLLRITADGGYEVVATGHNPPWNGVDHAGGSFFVAEGGVAEGGRILRIDAAGSLTVLAEGLPSQGDHHTNGPLVHDGWVYFGQGTVTNSGVVGTDNADFGWLPRFPRLHDVPCEDVTLSGRDFESPDPLADRPGATAVTGAFKPFGVGSAEGEVVPGGLLCNGAVMRLPVDGGAVELVAWGFRNPFGLATDGDGVLYATDNLYDVRGSRPVFGAGDLLWRVEAGRWYGWPDFHAGRPLTIADHYAAPGASAPGFLLAEHPDEPPTPAAVLAVHSSSNGFDISRSDAFGFEGDAFIAQFGDMTPGAGKVLAPSGYRVVRVDVDTGIVEDFVVNREGGGPASFHGTAGIERPVAARFDPDGSALYIVDFGVMLVTEEGPVPIPGTGVLWRVSRGGPR